MNKILIFAFAGFLLSGCVDSPKPFMPKALNDGARGISIVTTTPYGCKVLGEIEGSDEMEAGYTLPTKAMLRKGAINDLKNEAVYVTGKNKRVTIRIIREKAVCVLGQNLIDCTDTDTYHYAKSYKINAQVFECGSKD